MTMESICVYFRFLKLANGTTILDMRSAVLFFAYAGSTTKMRLLSTEKLEWYLLFLLEFLSVF